MQNGAKVAERSEGIFARAKRGQPFSGCVSRVQGTAKKVKRIDRRRCCSVTVAALFRSSPAKLAGCWRTLGGRGWSPFFGWVLFWTVALDALAHALRRARGARFVRLSSKWKGLHEDVLHQFRGARVAPSCFVFSHGF